jgi:glucose/arabinose dehydrogenase
MTTSRDGPARRRLAKALAGVAISAGLAGCSPNATASPSGFASGPQSSGPSPTGAAASSQASPSAGPTGGGFDPSKVTVALEPVVDVPDGPLGVVDAGDGTGRLFVATQAGRIWTVTNGRRADHPFLDVSGEITTGGERGLLGLAFHPKFPEDPRFFIDYTDGSGNTVVAQLEVTSPTADADPRSEKALLHVDQPFPNHNGGSLQFGPDGYLYVSLGDGGSGGDPQGNGRRLDTYLAKILRIDVDHPSGDRAYGIPADNPFVDRADAKPEIWLTGLRNPWRMSFDRQTDDLWIGDVGQGSYEEIDVVRAGAGGGEDFGWNVTEGFHCFPSGDSCDRSGLTSPITEYAHGNGDCSVTGGYVYRGRRYPALEGAYLFADYCTGRVWAIDAASNEVHDPPVVLESGRQISSFGEDADGELYATDLGGTLLSVTGAAH